MKKCDDDSRGTHSSRAKSNKWDCASSREPGERRDHNKSDKRDCVSPRRRFYGLDSERRDRDNKDLFPICQSGTPNAMQHVARRVAVVTVEGPGDILDLNNLAGSRGTDDGAAELHGDEAVI